MLEEGWNISLVANTRDLSEQTVCDHIADLIRSKQWNLSRARHYVSGETLQEVEVVLTDSEENGELSAFRRK